MLVLVGAAGAVAALDLGVALLLPARCSSQCGPGSASWGRSG